MEAMSAVSSPQTKAPAPSRISMWKLNREPQMLLPEQAQALGLLDGGFQVLDGQRVFGADVDEALLRAHGIAGDGHAFEHAVRVAFEHGAIHEGAGIALVGVADDVLLLLAGLGHGGPLEAGGIARAAAAPQTAADHLFDDFGRSAFGNALHQGQVAVLGDVVFDPFGIDAARIFEHDLLLALEEGSIGGAVIEAVAAGIEVADDLGGLFGGDVGI